MDDDKQDAYDRYWTHLYPQTCSLYFQAKPKQLELNIIQDKGLQSDSS